MAPKRSQASAASRESTPSTTATQTQTIPASTPIRSTSKNNQSPTEIAIGIWENYLDATPQRTKLIDVFMAFLVVVGVLQFVYCVIAGNYVSTHSLEWIPGKKGEKETKKAYAEQ
jgi:oligosaccharyltransferase complex subunit epsilon